MTQVKFYLDNRPRHRGPTRPLFAQVQTEVGRFRDFLGVHINPELWDARRQVVLAPRGGAQEARSLTDELDRYRLRVAAAWLKSGGDKARCQALVKLGDQAPPPPAPLSLQQAIDLRLADRKSLDSASTRAGFEQLRRAVDLLGGDKPLPLDQLTYSFYVELRDYFLGLGQINSSVNVFLGKFRTALTHVAERHAERVGTDLADRLSGLAARLKHDKLPDDLPDIIIPDYADVLALAELDLSTRPKLALTRDRYVFACFTGPRHSDLNRLEREFALALDEGQMLLRYLPHKTKRRTPIEVPLNAFAYDYIARHQHRPRLLDQVDNRRENERLHEVLLLAGGRFANRVLKVSYRGSEELREYLPRYEAITFHSSRHFFAVTLINAGVPTDFIKELLGQKNINTTLRYAKVQAGVARQSAAAVLDRLGHGAPLYLP